MKPLNVFFIIDNGNHLVFIPTEKAFVGNENLTSNIRTLSRAQQSPQRAETFGGVDSVTNNGQSIGMASDRQEKYKYRFFLYMDIQ